jgi:Mg-chelatase subunit ChlD
MMTDNYEAERLRRWRLILGGSVDASLSPHDHGVDNVLCELYGKRMMRHIKRAKFGKKRRWKGDRRTGSMGVSMPNVSQWLGDIREYFPDTVVQVMQQDAIEAIGLRNLLTEPEILDQIQPDVNLVATLLALKDVIPTETKDTARLLVRKVVDDLMRRLESHMRQAIYGALNKAQRTRRPRHHDIDWNRTIRSNLKHYQEDYHTIIPELLIGFGRRKRTAPHHIIICIDQSGSMAASIVYASVFGAVMASISVLKTSLLVFDTAVVDMTPLLHDPVDLLFGTALGGGTDINQALGYCQNLIEHPQHTTLVLISDLYEGGNHDHFLRRAEHLIKSGTQFVALLALSDYGAPAFNRDLAAELASLGAAAFACTPDLFPELMAATMNGKDLRLWSAQHDVNIVRPKNYQSTTS